jgi:pimeloyl-ACP methyl ester carboxylesterase
MAELTYQPGADGRWHPLWDTSIATLLDGPVPDLWTLFGALAHLPVLLLWGEQSNILERPTIERMQRMHPSLKLVPVPDVGHAPTLSEPVVVAALRDFLRTHG